jgi:hypothetical protein
MRLFCHLCRRLAFRDTCGKCRKVIDAHYEQQLRLMRGLMDAGIVTPQYYVQSALPTRRKQWRH